jgi:hypothetical protein
VEEVFQRRWGVIWEVAVGEQVLRTTAEHPFWVKGRGWTAASQLRVGDALRSHDGQWLAVEDVRDTGRAEAVYNGRVAEYHTYFVGDEQWGFSLWAHNSCGPGGATPNPVIQVGEGISNWLGQGARVVRNDAGGFVILSRDGLRRFRIDFAGPGTPPAHAHFEVWDPKIRDWVDAIPGRHRIPFRQ